MTTSVAVAAENPNGTHEAPVPLPEVPHINGVDTVKAAEALPMGGPELAPVPPRKADQNARRAAQRVHEQTYIWAMFAQEQVAIQQGKNMLDPALAEEHARLAYERATRYAAPYERLGAGQPAAGTFATSLGALDAALQLLSDALQMRPEDPRWPQWQHYASALIRSEQRR